MKRLVLATVVATWSVAGGAWATTGIGVTSAVLPQATGTAPESAPRVLEVGSDVVADERIVTGEVGKTHLLFLDGSALTVGPGSDLVLDEFVYDPDTKTGKIAVSASKGLLRFVGGRISKTTPVIIKTPSATIGIRGGIAIVKVGALTTAKFLFGEELTVSAGGVTQVMTRPGFQISVNAGEAPAPPVPADPRAFANDVDNLEGNPRQPGQRDKAVDDNDVGRSQLGELGSRREPRELERGGNEREGGREGGEGRREGPEGRDGDRFGEGPLNDDFRDDRFADMADVGDGGAPPPPPTAGTVVDIGDAIPDTQSVMPFDDFMLVASAETGTIQVTVRSIQPTLGSFTAQSIAAAGFGVSGDGSLVFFGTPEDAEAALGLLVFQPSPNQAPPGQTRDITFSVSATDGFVNATNTQTTITTFSINDAPTLSGALAGQSVTDKAQIMPFASVAIADPDPGETVTVTVQVANAASGGFTAASLGASGFVDLGGGTYRFTGSPAAAQAALRGLSFAPSENQVAVGGSTTATFTVIANDGDAVRSDGSTTVVIDSINDAPMLNALAAATTAPVQSVTPFAGLTVVDPDVATTVTATVQIGNVAQGSFSAASVAGAGFTNLGGGTYRFSGSPGQTQAAIRQLAFVGADGRVTTGNSETVQFTVSINDGSATTPATYAATVTCADLCRYDLTGRVKLGNDPNIGTDDITAASNRPLVNTSTISGNRFKATTAQGTYNLFLPTQSGTTGTSFSFGGTSQPASSPEGAVTGNGFLAPNADYLFYEIDGSRQFLFAGKAVSGFSFNDATFNGATYELIADFTLGGSRLPFIPQSLLDGVAAPANPTLTVLFGSGNAAEHRFFHGAAVTISGTGGAQRAAGSVIVGLAASDPAGAFHLSGSMAGVVTGGAAGDQPMRILSPVASTDDGGGNDVFGGANPRFMVLESAAVDSADTVLSRGGTRSRGSIVLPDPVFANQPALNTDATFTTFTGTSTGPSARTGGSTKGFAGGISFDYDSVGNPEGVRGFFSEGTSTDAASGVSVTRSLATNRMIVSMKLQSQVAGGFSFGGSVDTILAYGGAGAAEAGRSAFQDNNTFVALDNPSGSQINGTTGGMDGFFVTQDQVTFANGAIPAGVTICTCADVTWGFFSAFLADASGTSYEIPLAQWVAGEQANSGQIVGLSGTATYDGTVIAGIAIGDSVNPAAVSRYTTVGGFSLDIDIDSGSANLLGGTIDLDGATYSLSPTGPAGATPGEYFFSLSGPAGRFGNGSGDLFGPGSPPSSTAGRFSINNGTMPTYQASGIYFGENTNFSP
ncbi:MAG: FecR domain-containing protein [Alphaproteobacteria bacterium]